MNKPDGLTFIGPSRILEFMKQLPVEKFFGVGKVTAAKMKSMNLFTGADLKKLSETELIHHFGKSGKFYFNMVRGIDDRPVQPHRETKSVAAEDTFEYDLETYNEMHKELRNIAERVSNRLARYNLKGRTLTLKIKFSDFKQITRNHSFPFLVADAETIYGAAEMLLSKIELTERKVRLLGISISNFEMLPDKGKSGDSFQLELF